MSFVEEPAHGTSDPLYAHHYDVCPYNHGEVYVGVLTTLLGTFGAWWARTQHCWTRFEVLFSLFALSGVVLFFSAHVRHLHADVFAHTMVTIPMILLVYMLHEDQYLLVFAQIHFLSAFFMITSFDYFYEMHMCFLVTYALVFVHRRLKHFCESADEEESRSSHRNATGSAHRKLSSAGLGLYHNAILCNIVGGILLLYVRYHGCQSEKIPKVLEPMAQMFMAFSFYLGVAVFILFRRELLTPEERERYRYRSKENMIPHFQVTYFAWLLPYLTRLEAKES